jgi:hypothetical protein
MTTNNGELVGGVAFDGFHHRRGIEIERGKTDKLTGFVDLGSEGEAEPSVSQQSTTQTTLTPPRLAFIDETGLLLPNVTSHLCRGFYDSANQRPSNPKQSMDCSPALRKHHNRPVIAKVRKEQEEGEEREREREREKFRSKVLTSVEGDPSVALSAHK